MIPYSLPITYVWYINGETVSETSHSLVYHFIDGSYMVTIEASYQIPRCEPCTRTQSLTVIVEGMKDYFLLVLL